MDLPCLTPLARFDFLGAHKLPDVIRVKVGKPDGFVGSQSFFHERILHREL